MKIEDEYQKALVKAIHLRSNRLVLPIYVRNEEKPYDKSGGAFYFNLLSMGYMPGCSDLILTWTEKRGDPGRCVFVEVKKPADLITGKGKGRMSAKQRTFKRIITELGMPYYLWDTGDTEEVIQWLTKIGAPIK